MNEPVAADDVSPAGDDPLSAAEARAARLSDDGLLVLRLLDEHRVLTTAQLVAITGAPVRTVEYRLARLHSGGLVGKVRPPVQRGSAPLHWWLSAAGARLVSGAACADGVTPNPLFVRHAAATADLWLALRGHRPHTGLELTGWWREAAGWTDWQPTSTGAWGPAGRRRRVAPDAVFHAAVTGLADADGTAPVGAAMVEIDLGTMTVGRIRAKLARYHAYAQDAAWASRHPHCPVLLILTTTPARAANIARAAARHSPGPQGGRRGGQQVSRWAAPLEDRPPTAEELVAGARRLLIAVCGLVRDPARAVAERCWLLPADPAAEVRLVDLLADRVHAQQQAAVAARRDAEAQAAARRTGTIRALRRSESDQDFSLDDPAASQVFAVLTRSEEWAVRGWIDSHPQAGELLLWWWGPKRTSRYEPVGPPPTELLAALAGDYPGWWRQQADRLLGADRPISIRAPGWAAAAVRLLEGRLLRPAALDGAAEAYRGRDDAQAQLFAPTPDERDAVDYLTRRDQAAVAAWRQLGFLDRRHKGVEQLADGYDREHLQACRDCGLAIPRDQHASRCMFCGGGLADWPGPARPFEQVVATLARREVPPAWMPPRQTP